MDATAALRARASEGELGLREMGLELAALDGAVARGVRTQGAAAGRRGRRGTATRRQPES